MRSAELFAKALLIWPGPDVPKVNVAPEPIERFCRGDWGAPKSDASNTTIAVNRCAIERIHHLKLLVVELKAGHAIRKYRVVKSDKPDDLVFQSVQSGKPLRDNNILSRFIKPAARNMGLPWVNV